jgi:hypothetical protein
MKGNTRSRHGRVIDHLKTMGSRLAQVARRYGPVREQSAPSGPDGGSAEGAPWQVPAASLLQNHYSDEAGCLCLDLFIRLLAIEEFAGGNSHGIALYRKLWAGHKRRPREVGAFKELVDSFAVRGFDRNKPISLQKHPERRLDVFADGKHRFVCALYFGIETVPVRRSARSWPIADNSSAGLLRIGFTHVELDQIFDAEARYRRGLGFDADPGVARAPVSPPTNPLQRL